MSIKNEKKSESQINATSLDVSPDNIPAEQLAEVVERSASLIYLGPNLPAGRLLQSTVFRDGIPAYLESLLVEQPDVASLIVPVDEMSGVQARIIQSGTAESVAYQSILKGGL